MKKEILVIGGGPAGIITATTAKKTYPEKTVAVVRKEKTGLVPCGIPYIFGTLNSVDANIMGIKPAENLGVEFIIDEVTAVDFERKTVLIKSGNKIEYEKLVFATGSKPVLPPIEGKELKGVFTIAKNKEYMEEVFNFAKSAKRVVIVGGGFIGIEVGDEIRKMGKEVAIVEAMPHLLPAAFDEEFGKVAEEKLAEHGTSIKTNIRVSKILGSESVTGIEFEDGKNLPADMIIFATGYKPNTGLVQNLDIHLGYSGAIWVDEYMRTSVRDVFAVGDCAEHKDFFTRKPSRLMLASTAVFDARVAGANLYHLKVVRENHGNLGVFSTSIEGLTLGAAGMTERTACAEGFECVIGEAKSVDRHPGTLPDKSPLYVKLVFSKESGLLLGAQIAGGKSVGEMINILGLGLQMGVTANDLVTMQIGTHPLLTSAPTAYPLVLAAESAIMKLR